MTSWNIQSKNVSSYSGATKNSSTFSNVSKALPSLVDYKLLIDDTYAFLIDDTYFFTIDSQFGTLSWNNSTKH